MANKEIELALPNNDDNDHNNSHEVLDGAT